VADWMSDGNELQRSDAATGNVRRPTVVSRRAGRRHEQDHSCMVARETMQHTKCHDEMP